MNQTHGSPAPKRLLSISAVVFILIGAATALGGIRLVALHGSWYYLLAGLGVLATGVLLGESPVRSGARPLVVALLIAAVVGIVSLFVDVDASTAASSVA